MKKIILIAGLLGSSIALANSNYYIAADAGIFEGNFNQQYADQTDTIPQNFEQNSFQNGYTAGIALGYTKPMSNRYALGAEISGQGDTNSATFAAGNASLTDKTKFDAHSDITFVPRMHLSQTVDVFMKLGMSVAWTTDTLTSPTGFASTMTSYKQDKTLLGGVAGLGISKALCKQLNMFAEGDYRDYGNNSFQGFSNFTASYTHQIHIYSYDMLGGVAYTF